MKIPFPGSLFPASSSWEPVQSIQRNHPSGLIPVVFAHCQGDKEHAVVSWCALLQKILLHHQSATLCCRGALRCFAAATLALPTLHPASPSQSPGFSCMTETFMREMVRWERCYTYGRRGEEMQGNAKGKKERGGVQAEESERLRKRWSKGE